jgi:hypothetical protein
MMPCSIKRTQQIRRLGGIIALLLASNAVSAQATVDLENKYPSVGAIMIWRVDGSGKPVELVAFVSGTLIRDRVMVTAGHFTGPFKALGGVPPTLRVFASFSPGNAKDRDTWVPVVRTVTHASMPACPPPPQCDPTDDSLVAPLQPGIADVGLVFLQHAPKDIKPARLVEQGTLEKSEGAQTTIVGYGTTVPRNPRGSRPDSTWDAKRRVRTSKLRRVIDETWALWSIPSYVCSGDSGGAIFMNARPDKGNRDEELVANVSDGGKDCRGHNNNNRLDTRSIQNWINETIRQQLGDP